MTASRGLTHGIWMVAFVPLMMFPRHGRSDDVEAARDRAKSVVADYLKAEPKIEAFYTASRGTCNYKHYQRIIRQSTMSNEEARGRALRGLKGFADIPETLTEESEVQIAYHGSARKVDARRLSRKVEKTVGGVPTYEDVAGGPRETARFVICDNGSESFTLEWKPAASRPTVLSHAETGKLSFLLETGGNAIIAPFSTFFGEKLSTKLKDPTCVLDGASDVDLDGQKCVELLLHTPTKRKDLGDRHMRVVLSPEDGWVVRKAEVWASVTDVAQAVSVQYGKRGEGETYPELLGCHIELINQRRLYEFHDFKHTEVPEGEFRITAYGLPDLGAPAPPPSTDWTGWLIGGGVASLLGAVGLGAAARRARSKSPQAG